MTIPISFAEPSSATLPSEDWVLSISLDEPGQVLPGSVRWVERGPLRGFFDGLLFDRDALSRSINRDKADCSNADLVLQAYERGGEAVFQGLRGSFVVAVIDRNRGIAIVARDPVGSHPLFYAEANSRVLFATSPHPLLDQPGVSRALNRAALADHLCERWPDRHETFFAAVRRVPPGWRAVIAARRLHLEHYWDPVPLDRPIQWLTKEEAARFDDVFDLAVDRCLSTGPTGILLSGGLDSISVAAVATDRARRFGQRPPIALSLVFPDPECNERVRQASVARDLGLRQHLVDFDEAVGFRPILEQGLRLGEGLAAPIMSVWHPAYLELARRARVDGVRTILTGQGGDEWLCITPYLSADLIRRGGFAELLQLYGTFRRSYQLRPLAVIRTIFWTYGLRPLAGSAIHQLMPNAHNRNRINRQLAGDPVWVAPDRALREAQRDRADGGLTPSDPPQGFYLREIREGLDHTLISWDIEERYELEKRVGVRFLHPFWDPDFVEMLCRMPPRMLNEGGRSKGLVRGTVARRFPGLGLERQRKVSGTSFFRSLLVREGPAVADEAGDFPALSALGVVDGRATRAFVCEELKQPSRQLYRVLQAIKLEMWVRSRGG
jgi:asparagine synthetase B (glutamine-hydrolysing)